MLSIVPSAKTALIGTAAATALALSLPSVADASTVQFSGALVELDAGFNEINTVTVKPSFGSGVTLELTDLAGISGCTQLSSITVRCPPSDLKEFAADLGNRNDAFTVDTGAGVSFVGAVFDIEGDLGDDTLRGADNPFGDLLQGGDGRDRLEGNGGDDALIGGGGVDGILGGDGADTIDGNTHDDHLYGEAGDDLIRGGDGNDTVHGGAGSDRLEGNGAADTIVSNADDLTRDVVVCQGGDHVFADLNDLIVNPSACADVHRQ
jgi:hypothetical protein